MRGPYLLACLSPYRFLHSWDKHEALLGDDDTFPAPHPLEVFLADVSKSESFVADTIVLEGGFSLLKGRVTPADVMKNELAAGRYEGGLRLSKSAIELVNTLRREVQDGRLCFRGKRVLELGCGHGLPGIFACLKGASTVHFQDFNVEVLSNLTIPNVISNLELIHSRQACLSDARRATGKLSRSNPELHFYAGDWGDMSNMLSLTVPDEGSSLHQENALPTSRYADGIGSAVHEANNVKKWSSGSRACDKGLEDGDLGCGYDIILMSDTVYSLLSLPKLYDLLKKCLRAPYGVVYLAGKKHYFGGSSGGTRQFKAIVEDEGYLGAHLVKDSIESQEIWKFFFR